MVRHVDFGRPAGGPDPGIGGEHQGQAFENQTGSSSSLKMTNSKVIIASHFYFFLFIKLMQPKVMKLFTLEGISQIHHFLHL